MPYYKMPSFTCTIPIKNICHKLNEDFVTNPKHLTTTPIPDIHTMGPHISKCIDQLLFFFLLRDQIKREWRMQGHRDISRMGAHMQVIKAKSLKTIANCIFMYGLRIIDWEIRTEPAYLILEFQQMLENILLMDVIQVIESNRLCGIGAVYLMQNKHTGTQL